MAFEFGALVAIAALAWLWLASLNARDAAVEAARRACAADGVQLLDDTVMLTSIRPARDGDGGVVLRRVYRFEFSDTGDTGTAIWSSRFVRTWVSKSLIFAAVSDGISFATSARKAGAAAPPDDGPA